ncbi:ATP-dependent helicase [Mesobacillus subterraneus]|uniref:ATP-dependent helicase n=1 Tax=Mesobacillus subterraneus TaxID=285983 RepID=UPI00203A5D15|nr:ATP-dependent helicase [Mesobacillus subterraneus]MCM3663082.1 ATP-dependent helicase [Mesobacillus subterraneus]MCM3682742.1 ATP-dependent helicase [Mesobacillus subterraneus]
MKTAKYNQQIISLEQYSREDYQKLYDDGKKGMLTCSVCGDPVRLYLGIQDKPHFYHHLSNKEDCNDLNLQDTNPAKPAEITEYTEQNGFRIPRSRSITAEAEKEEQFVAPREIKIPSPFMPIPPAVPGVKLKYLKQLKDSGIQFDGNQEQAVMSTDGPFLILAGAGSGKTRVLTARTAFMLEEKKIDPGAIMLVTFTAKAAAEMKKRITHYPGMSPAKVNQLVAGTFHSIFYRILCYHEREKWSSDKLMKKDWQREHILKEAGRKLHLDEKEFAYDLALQQIGLWKNTMIMPNEVKPESPWEEKVALLYKDYELAKERQQIFDFDDMLLGCFKLFKSQPDILENYQNRFQYFLIDEFQDINKVQYELVKMLSGKTENVCAVGDDDQSIYSFRGSDPAYLFKFKDDFKETKLIILNQNYRSPHEIVETANTVISANLTRHEKDMKAQFSGECPPVLFHPYDEEEEATMILTDIKERIENDARPSDFAILFRTNAASRAVFERLANSSLPFRVDQDIESFYERFMVKGMLSFLRLSLNPDDSEAVKNILPSLFLKQSIFRDLQANSILNDCSMLEALAHVKTGFAFQEQKLKKLIPIVRSLSSLGPVTAIDIVEKDLGYQDFIKKRGNEGNQLEKGSDDIRDLKVAARNFKTVAEFIEHADHMTAMNAEVKRSSKNVTDAITLSTIHRAKGLEYENVYIIGTVDGSIPHDYALDSYRNGDRQPMEEERRLLYVAVTRAQKNLFISVPQRRRGRKVNPSRFLANLKRRLSAH